ncbi:MAG: hypothetical protein GC168_20415 [Candidatus Hydrogenedens sp.]|nr:hypothetical protein [Candidatus Hydrogenedens sp.]
MDLPDVGAHPRQLENLRVGGGYGSLPDGGADIDARGRIATNGDVTLSAGLRAEGLVSLGEPSTQVISGGAVTIARSHYQVDTEGLASADDLDSIHGGSPGDLLLLRSVNAARVVTVRNGTGNLHTGADIVLDSPDKTLLLVYQGTGWMKL